MNDAAWHSIGKLSIHLTFGRQQKQTSWTDRREITWADLVRMLTTHAIGAKDGPCIVPAVLRQPERKKMFADQIGAVFLDSDTGVGLAALADAVRARGWAGAIHSTHSHLGTITRVRSSNWNRYREAHEDASPDRFLIEDKQYLPHIAVGASVEPVSRETDDFGRPAEYVHFTHQPCPRYRVVLPLLRPWRAADYPTQARANDAWKRRIEAVAHALGLQHDQSCTDTSRLFFLPRRPANGPQPETVVIEGVACDLFALPAAPPPDKGGNLLTSNGKSANGSKKILGMSVAPKVELTDPNTGELFDLRNWAADYGQRFKIADALRERKPGVLTGHVADNVKVHIRCPNEDAHTDAGADSATFVINAGRSENGGFVVHCRHAHCAGMDRLGMVKLMVERKWLSIADLTQPTWLLGEDDTEATGQDAEAADAAKVKPEGKAKLIAEFNKRYMVVNEGGKTLVYEPAHDVILKRRHYTRIGFDDFRRLYMNRIIRVGTDGDGKPILKTAANLWLAHPHRKQYVGGVTFDPSAQHVSSDTLNLWQGFAVQPRAGSWSLLKEHMRNVICAGDARHYDYLIGWMARLIQRPGEQGEIAVVLRGVEGSGKGTLAKALLHILGQHGLAISNSKHLVGNFNGHLRDCVFLFCDEAFFAGDRAHVGVLKSLITEPFLTIEAKYANAVQMRNFVHLMMASNEDWVVPASLEARRFFVLEVSRTKANDHDYFGLIYAELENGGYEAMLHDLSAFDLTKFNHRRAPVTNGLHEQRKQSLTTELAWWLDVLHRGYVYKSRHGLEYFAEWHDDVSTELLVASYEAFANHKRERHPLSREMLGRFLKSGMVGAKAKRLTDAVVGEHVGDVQSSIGRSSRQAVLTVHPRPPGYHIGTLAAARAALSTTADLPVDWQDPPDAAGPSRAPRAEPGADGWPA